MFSAIRLLAGELHGVSLALKALLAIQEGFGPADERLKDLELTRAQFEADMEGLLLKCENQLKAARATESRTRTMKASYDNQLDPFDPGRPEEPTPVPERHAPTGEAEGLQPLHVDLAPDHKAQALARKWGMA